MYDAISQVAELEEKVYVELKVEFIVLYSIQVMMPFTKKKKKMELQVLTCVYLLFLSE